MFLLNSGSSHLLSMLTPKRLWRKKSYHSRWKIWKHLHLMTLMKGRFSQHCILKEEVSVLPFMIFITKVFCCLLFSFCFLFLLEWFFVLLFLFLFCMSAFLFLPVCVLCVCFSLWFCFCVWKCVRHYIINLVFLCCYCVILPYISLLIQVVPRNE